MRFSLTLLLTALASIATAQNPFLYNPGDLTNITAGSTFEIKWAPSTGTTDTVTILLRQGNPDQLVTVLTIASSIVNTGSYNWSVPTTLVNGPLYAFEIRDDLNTDLANYSNTFSISSTNTVSSVVAAPVSTITTDGHVTTVYAVATQTTSATGTASASTTGTGTASGSSATATKNAAGEGIKKVKLGGAMLAVVAGLMGAL